MIYSQLLQLYNQSALLKGAFFLVLIIGLGPILLGAPAYAQDPGSGGGSAHSVPVNINTADAKSLAAGLKGIGPSRAEDIVRYRETYGPFASIDELAEVKGVGKSTIDKNREVLILE